MSIAMVNEPTIIPQHRSDNNPKDPFKGGVYPKQEQNRTQTNIFYWLVTDFCGNIGIVI
ncbi:hypothetical protein ACFL3G_12030 [Planctomycetota bacterium]